MSHTLENVNLFHLKPTISYLLQEHITCYHKDLSSLIAYEAGAMNNIN